MPDISRIKLPSGTTYDVKDAVARSAIANIHTFTYMVCTQASDTPYGVKWDKNGTTITGTLVASNDTMYKIYLVPSTNGTNDTYDEYITVNPSGTTYKWEMFGNTDVHLSDLGNMAYADTGTVTIQPKGSNASSTVRFANHSTETFVKGVSVTTQPTVTVTENAETSTGAVEYVKSITTSGTNSVTFATSGNTASAVTGYASPTTDTFVKSYPGTTSKLKKVSKYVAESATGGGSVTAGTAASLSMTMGTGDNAETLNISWTANTPTAVTLPSFSSQSIADGTLASDATGASVMTGLGTASTASGLTGLGTASTATVLKSTVTATVPKVVATTKYLTASASGTAVGASSTGSAITALGAATADAQVFTGTSETHTVSPVPKT